MFGKKKRRERHKQFKEFLTWSQTPCNPVEYAHRQNKLLQEVGRLMNELLEDSIKK